MTTSTAEARVKYAVRADTGWAPDEFEVRAIEAISLAPCAFFSVTHEERPIHAAASYALLPDGSVVSRRDDDAATRILSACGDADATAGSWAEVLARFHPAVAPGMVLYDAAIAQEALAPVIASGKKFAPPSLVRKAIGTAVRFFLLNVETGTVYEVRAARKPDGRLEVTKEKAG